jgi:putative Mg2+ transporter-C (MgtC) family protein
MNSLWDVDPGSLHIATTILAKLGIGAVLAGLIGWERERGGRAAGIRTHMLMILGVILFSEVSKAFVGADPSRIAAQILTGIGFLGAGTILRVGPEIKGLTTAASIWAVSAIGMAISVGGAFMIVALVATVFTLLTLALVTKIEQKLFPHSYPNELSISMAGKADIAAVLLALNEAGMRITQTQVLKVDPTTDLVLRVTGDKDLILRTACALPGVLSAGWKG